MVSMYLELVSRPIEDSEMVVDNRTGITLTMQVMSYPPPDHVSGRAQ